jgi:hypothetical protein
MDFLDDSALSRGDSGHDGFIIVEVVIQFTLGQATSFELDPAGLQCYSQFDALPGIGREY